MENKYVHIVYKTTNKINSKIYVGVHKTSNLSLDTYYGSGKYFLSAMNKYGKWNFEREILYIYHSKDVAYKRESYIVDKEFLEREDTYNIKLGGFGGWDHCHTDYIRARINKTNSLKYGNNMGLAGTPELRDKQRSNHLELYGNKYWNIHKPETRKKVTLSNIESGHYNRICYNSPESLDKKRATHQCTALAKYPILNDRYSLVNPNSKLVLEGNLLEISLHIFGTRQAVKRHTRLVRERQVSRRITRGDWKDFVVNKL